MREVMRGLERHDPQDINRISLAAKTHLQGHNGVWQKHLQLHQLQSSMLRRNDHENDVELIKIKMPFLAYCVCKKLEVRQDLTPKHLNA